MALGKDEEVNHGNWYHAEVCTHIGDQGRASIDTWTVEVEGQ